MYVCEPSDFKNAGVGVYKKHPSNCSELEYTHTSVIVGYGTNKNGDKYWELLNSYGEQWGNEGMIRLARDTEWDNEGGQNGILYHPAYNTPELMFTYKNGKSKEHNMGNYRGFCIFDGN